MSVFDHTSHGTCDELFGHRRGDVLIWFLLLSLHCHRVCSNDLRMFTPPLMLRVISSLLSTSSSFLHQSLPPYLCPVGIGLKEDRTDTPFTSVSSRDRSFSLLHQSLLCENWLPYEGPRRKSAFDSTTFEKIEQSGRWSSQVGAIGEILVFLLWNFDDIMDEDHSNVEL